MKLNKRIIIATILIFCVLLIIFIEYKVLNKKDNYGEKSNLTPDDIIELLSYIPYSLLNSNSYQNAYYGSKVTSENTLVVILSPILMNRYLNDYAKDNSNFQDKLQEYNMVYGSVYSIKDVNNYLLKRYNLKLNNIKDISDKIKMVKLDDTYMAFSNVGNSNIRTILNTLLSVEDAYTIKDEAIITEKVLFYELKDKKYYIYKNTNISDDKNIIKIYDKIDENGKELSYTDIFNKIKEDFGDYQGTFKHTFKQNKTGYYWYSTEFIEE